MLAEHNVLRFCS